ncbi:hypothetical protein GCM10023216_29650 [Isoptericola chiayiensis]|uniref:AMIN-like domain-containing protein n=1 Tax=Isoptericola chiayiensis TaxID=579446 RepID=A0ABP8YP97_9MICO|nr:hypothetical protein [Isoptericola chiayiensis]NOW01879.1 hypothetical protein [Isoptericola chiayiensis]
MRTQPRRRTATAAAALATVLLVGACGDADLPGYGGGTGDDDATAGETATSEPTEPTEPTDEGSGDGAATSESASPSPGDEPEEPFEGGTGQATAEPGGSAMLTVTDVRVGAHDGYDRVVFDLDGEGTPGWRVEYVDEALDDGSGNPVEVDGDAVLQVAITGTAMPMDSGVTEYSGDPVDGPGTSVDQVVYRFVFEGITTAFVGVDGEPRPFRVFALEDPARVVVDVGH